MKTFQKVMFMIAFLVLMSSIIHTVFVRFLVPTKSVLARFGHPVKDDPLQAESMETLLTRYGEVIKKTEALLTGKTDEQIKLIRAQHPALFAEEEKLTWAILDQENKSQYLFKMWFYWVIGAICLGLGGLSYFKWSRWFGLSLIVLGFCEMIYWGMPSVTTGGHEAVWKMNQEIILSIVNLGLLFLVAILMGVFRNGDRSAAS